MYVMNASELSNQNLAALLYTKQNKKYVKPTVARPERSRNITDSVFNKQSAAG